MPGTLEAEATPASLGGGSLAIIDFFTWLLSGWRASPCWRFGHDAAH